MLVYAPEHVFGLAFGAIMASVLILLYVAAAVQIGVRRLRAWWRR